MTILNDRLAHLLVAYRGRFALLTMLIVIALCVGLTKLQFNGSYKIFFDEDNPHLLAHEHNESTYTKSNNLLFIVAPADGDIFTQQTLHSLETLTESSWQLPYSSRVDSITNFQHTEVIEDDLLVANLVEGALDLSQEDIARIRQIASKEDELLNRLLSDRLHVAGVNVVLNLPDDTMHAEGLATKEVVAAARALRDQIIAENPELTIHMQGLSIVNNAFNESAEYDVANLFPILFLIIIVMLLVLLRSFWSSIITTIVIVVSVVASEGFIGWIGYDLNQVNVMAPIIILTLAVCDCVHILASYLHHLALAPSNTREDKVVAMTEALKINLQPVFLTSLTTAIGFLAMNTSDVPPFRELGNFSAFGVMAAFVLSVGLLPFLAVAFPLKPKKIEQSEQAWVSKLSNFVINKRVILLPGVLLVATGMASLASLNELNDNTVEYFHESTEFRQASEFMEANLTGFDVINYSIDSGVAGGVNDPEFLQAVDNFAQWYLTQPEVINVETYTKTIKRLNKNMHGDDITWYQIPENRELASQYQLLYELSLPYGLDLSNRVDMEKRSLLLSVGVVGTKAKEMIELDKRAQAWMAENMPQWQAPGSGISTMFAHVGKQNIESMLSGSIIAIILITITLLFALSSFKFGMLSLLPNTFPAMIAFGCWGVAVGEVDLGIAVIFSLTLGIVVDDTVHFFSKYLRARQVLSRSPQEAVHYAFHMVAKPLVITTLVLVAGFSVLMLSTFNVNAKMGIMVSATIAIALIFDFLLLPALLMKFDKKSVAESDESQATDLV